jgi:type I restriction enzyme S subunit
MTWQPKKLNDLCEILIGGTPSRGVVEYWKNGTLPWVSIRDMSREGDLIENTNEKITEKGAKESNVKLIPKGSLLFSFKLSIGKLALAGSDLYTNEAIAALVIKDEKQLDKNFLRYYMSQMVFDDVTTAVKGSTLNKEKIKNLEIPLPPLATQRQIVAILDEKFAKLREAKRLREEAIEDTEKILATTLREIFEEGKEKGWEEKNLDEVARVINGRAYKQQELLSSGKYPVLRVGNFFTNRGWYYSDLELEPDKYCENGDLLYAWSASFGPRIWEGGKVIFHYHIWKIEHLENIDKKFLYYFLEAKTR